MASSLKNQIAAFFSGMKSDSALLFTTFGLDEVVLAQLLMEHKVQRDKRVIVFHDVMKHRNPGFL